KITYSFGGGFNMKGFDFSFMFQGISNVEIFNGFKQMGMTGRDVGNNMLADVLNSWNYNPNSGIPRLSIAGDSNGNYSKVSDFFLESGSYLRLKNITLGYTLPVKTMTSLGLAKSSVRFYISGDNLATFTNYSGFDPEVGNFGLDGGNYPVARSFRLGLNVNF
ncbi:MAG: SusC/RagA family TonB-linked outer membrane protein, partial [Dysgonomonas mossii]|nr:SusC/RagA family TonB-linked outer membrane protein [Dysgonomonas mossii]